MPSEPRSEHPAGLGRREALLFEAGVKLGGIFHQYLGTPIAEATAPGLARTIERAVALQPYVEQVRVRLRPAADDLAGILEGVSGLRLMGRWSPNSIF